VNYTRIGLAALGGFAVYFVVGGLTFTVASFRNEFLKYSAVYRPKEGQMSHMPAGMVAMFVAMVVLALFYALLYRGGSSLFEGARFGAMIAVFFLCTFVVHNYVNLNIGLKLTLQQAIAYSIEWTLVGIIIGLIYRPA
jgi:hypothetical protein